MGGDRFFRNYFLCRIMFVVEKVRGKSKFLVIYDLNYKMLFWCLILDFVVWNEIVFFFEFIIL